VAAPGLRYPVTLAEANPYGVSHVAGADDELPLTDDALLALDRLAERVVRIAARLAA
jgi:NAD(P)H dehydrogenase (quinone)